MEKKKKKKKKEEEEKERRNHLYNRSQEFLLPSFLISFLVVPMVPGPCQQFFRL